MVRFKTIIKKIHLQLQHNDLTWQTVHVFKPVNLLPKFDFTDMDS